MGHKSNNALSGVFWITETQFMHNIKSKHPLPDSLHALVLYSRSVVRLMINTVYLVVVMGFNGT